MTLDPAYQARIDEFLNSQKKPVQPSQMMVYDAQWRTIDFITPIGRILQCALDQPRAIAAKGQAPGPAKWQLTLGFSRQELLEDVHTAICMVANGANPGGVVRPDPNNMANMVTYTGEQMLFLPKGTPGKFWYPIQDGNDMYMQDPQRNECYRGLFYMNANAWPQTKKGAPSRPVFVDQHGNTLTDGSIFKRGYYARETVQAKWFDTGQNKGVGLTIKQVQFFAVGEELAGGGYDADAAAREAFASAGALPVFEPPMQSGYQPQAGFAAPPQQPAYQPAPPQQAQPAQQPNWNPPATGGGAFTPPSGGGTFIPPQQPQAQPPAGGFRLPGAR